MNNTAEYLIEQDERIQCLEKIKITLTKLNIERRSYDTIKRYYNQAEGEWKHIFKIHEELKNVSSDLPENYNEKLISITEVKKDIKTFVEKLFPELIKKQFDQSSLTSNDSDDDQNQVKEFKEITNLNETASNFKKLEDELNELEVQLKNQELASKIEELKQRLQKIDKKNYHERRADYTQQ